MEILKNATFLKNLATSFILILSSSAAFGLGRLTVLKAEKEPITIENTDIGWGSGEASSTPIITSPSASTSQKSLQEGMKEPTTPESKAPAPPPPSTSSESFVASKTGTAYYFPWCGIVKRIKPENLISFSSRGEAEKAGYKPGNCAGLK